MKRLALLLVAIGFGVSLTGGTVGCSKSVNETVGVQQSQLAPDHTPTPLGPGPVNQVLDVTVNNLSPYPIEAWAGSGAHKTIAANQTGHVLALARYPTVPVYARYLAYTATANITPRGLRPSLAVATVTVTRTGYGIIAIKQN